MIGGQGTVRCCALVASLGLCTGTVLADGTETLGPPSIVIAEGSDIIVAGVGLANGQPGDINVTVGPGLTVEQVILYWEGFADSVGEQGDIDTIMVNMIPVMGTRIGGPTNFFGSVWTSTYREDITALGQVGPGDNTLTIEGLDFGNVNDGAGVVVIVSDGDNTVIDLRDGNDTAFINFPAPRDTTVPQTFNFAPADEDRLGKFRMFFSSVSLGNMRPSIIRFSIDGVFAEDVVDALDSNDGADWDTFTNELTIPAGATSVTVQALSEDSGVGPFAGGLPASFVWNAAALALLPPGACCLIDGSCMVVTEEDCEAAGGTFQGVGTDCGDEEACCLPDNSCIDASPECCELLGGTPQGPGTMCTETEACCLPDGTCLDMDPLCCDDLGGVPQGPGSMCTPTGPEACCLPDNECILIDPVCCDDLGGTPQGPGSECTEPEACCLPDGTCEDMDPLCCDDLGGVPQGPGSMCTPTGPEACCLPDNECILIDPVCCDDLGGTPQGPGSECTEPEACCLPDNDCIMIDPACCDDLGGTPQGPGTMCTEPEACCLKDGTCLDMDPLCCDEIGGSPQGPGTMCSPDGPEACCLPDDSCVNVDPICCEYIGGEPQGPGTNCEMNPCEPGGEGCTPGYWKQMHHFDSWPDQYDPLTTTFAEVFGNDVYGTKTLLQVLSTGGGGLKALGRHTVAALLNAASDGVAYGLTPQEVIDAFNDVVPGDGDEQEALKDFFEGLNEQGCPLN